jgi:hypothetical protein
MLFDLVLFVVGSVFLGMGMGTGAFLGFWLWFHDTEWWPQPSLRRRSARPPEIVRRNR